MKRSVILSVILLIALAVPTVAKAQFRWGAEAGLNINSLTFKQDLVAVDQTVGYQAGVLAEMMFPGIGIGIDFGLIYDQRGAKVNLGQKEVWSSLGYGNEQVYLHSISIPFHLRFKWTRMDGLEDYVAPFVFAGPNFTIQAGHGKCDAFKYSGGDLGIEVGLGFEVMRHWHISGSYNWGMTYALKTKLLDDFSARSRTWAVRVAYFF